MTSFYQCKSISESYLSCIPGGVSATYELRVSPPNSNGSFCPGNIEFTCISQNAPRILNWFINGSSVAQYTFNRMDNYLTNKTDSSIDIAIVNVTSKSSIIDSVLTLSGNFSYLRGSFIQCGRDSILSDNIVVESYSKF